MKPSELLDKRIAELGDWRGAVVAKLRATVEESDPDLVLEWKWGTAVWSSSGLVCAVGALKDNAGLNFFRGASLPDPKGLFNACLDAKTSRFVRFYEGDRIDAPGVKALVKAAVLFNRVGGKGKVVGAANSKAAPARRKPAK